MTRPGATGLPSSISFFADFARLGVKPKIAITEYGLAKPDPDAKGDAMNVTKRIANSIADTAGYPPASLRDLLRLYADHVETVLYWEFQDQTWSGGLFGLLDTGGERKPIYDAYRRISHSALEERHPHGREHRGGAYRRPARRLAVFIRADQSRRNADGCDPAAVGHPPGRCRFLPRGRWSDGAQTVACKRDAPIDRLAMKSAAPQEKTQWERTSS